MRMIRVCSATAALLSACLVTSTPARSAPADALTKARSNCLAAVAKVVGLPRTSLSVIKDQRDASGISVEVKVPKAVAPWACLTNGQGEVKDTYFKGSEGAL